ncbi:MAG: hypothetical protein HFJ47_02685 [Clostridia bacterium]|nr:hypothetical protein [Clostridia bacterium]
MKNRTISDSLKPTFENVTREFITNTLYKILFSDELPNFKFDFREDEAITFIEKTLQDYRNQFRDESFIKELEDEHKRIVQAIKQRFNDNITQPVMIISNYKKFFELLRQFYERDIELYFLRTKMTGFPVYEKDNCFEQIWLRATPDDFNSPEEFLTKQVDMIRDRTLEKYDKETYLGKLDFLDDNIICIKNGIAKTWDENSREFEITIYDKKYYNNMELFDRPHCTLPLIRYGIYEKDGKKVCYIGSVQNKSQSLADKELYERQDINKKLNRKKYKVNSEVPEEYKDKVESKSILALSLFIDILNKEGITEIEIPCMYVLDYEYHEKISKKLLEDFNKNWTKDRKKRSPLMYREKTYYLERNYNKQDLISEIKTEGMIRKFERVLYHYPNGKIISYPGEVDSFFHFSIPVVKCEKEIKGDILIELYRLINERYKEIER